MARPRRELGNRRLRQQNAVILAANQTCIVCGHHSADNIDHIIPVSRGGSTEDPANRAPVHGNHGCPVCLRKCNAEKSDKPLHEVLKNHNSRDWFAEEWTE